VWHEAEALWVVRYANGHEELLCGPCAPWVAKMFELTLPPAEASPSAQTSEAPAATNSGGLGTNHRGNL